MARYYRGSKKPCSPKVLEDQSESVQTSSVGSPYKTPEAKRKAASRARKSEPEDPVKYAELKAYQLKQAMKSPRKNAALKALGINQQPVPFVQEKMISYLSFLKKDTTKEGKKQRKNLLRVLVKDSTQSVSQLSNQLKQRWHFVAAACTMSEEEEEMRAAVRHGHSLPEDLIKLVEDFYVRPETSIIIPDRKMVRKDMVPKQCLTKSLKAAHKEFVDTTGQKISLAKFKYLRPQHVLTVGNLKRTSCVCKTCANVSQKLDALRPLLQKANIPLGTSAKEAMDVTICHDKDDISKWLCLNRTCPDCGVNKFSEKLEPLGKEDRQIMWLRWQLTKSGSSQYMMNITKQGPVSDLLMELQDEMVPLAYHLGVAMWQYHQFRHLRTNLQSNHLLTLMDFAENYRCEYQKEVQAAHWSYTQVTVFPTVNYYWCESCPNQVTESVVIISADLVHDASAVHMYNTLVVQHLQKNRNITIQKQFQFTDGAGSQFKSREPFMDIAMSMSDHSFPIERSFFGSSHGKGPCDGVGGMVKAAARQAVLAEKVLIRDAAEMFQHLKETFTEEPQRECCHSRRIFLYVDKVERSRPGRRPVKAVKGTRKIHSVQATGVGNEICYRELSCYCTECISGAGCDGMKQFPQGRWKKHQFTTPLLNAESPQHGETTLPPTCSFQATVTPSASPSPPSFQGVPLSDQPSDTELATPSAGPSSCSQNVPSSAPSSDAQPSQAATTPSEGPSPSCSQKMPPAPPNEVFKGLLRSLQGAKDWTALESAAAEYEKQMQPVAMGKLQMSGCKVDQPSLTLYPSDGPSHLTPIAIYGDGNCLPRCGSFLAWGTEERHLEMRVRIAVELILHKAYYLGETEDPSIGNLPHFCAQYSDHYQGEVLSKVAIGRIFELEAMDILKAGTYMGMWQLLALSSVLHYPIFSIYPEYGGYNVRQHLHKVCIPRLQLEDHDGAAYLPGILWTNTQGKHQPALIWRPNHFVVCLPSPHTDNYPAGSGTPVSTKPGDFILVGVPKDKTVVNYIAQITKVTAEGTWGVYLKDAGSRKWKWPEKYTEFFIPLCDILRVFKEEDYRMSLEHRTVVYNFDV